MDTAMMLLGGLDATWVPIVAIGSGLMIAVIGVVAWAINSYMIAKQVEETKREVAAYVAEGSLSPDDAAKILAQKGAAPEGSG